MDGLLVIDKPAGPTSHDIVARVRRALREPRVGHTGTLDPAATGVLPLVLGRATRLARFMSGADKAYDAVVRLGIRTDTGDADGQIVGPAHEGPLPPREEIERALDAFRGPFAQQPPAFSAKKIGGKRSYRIARETLRAAAPLEKSWLSAANVATSVLELVTVEHALVALKIDCSAGFYVRSLAHDLGERLGIGAHLHSLRRTRSGDFTLADAATVAGVEADPAAAVQQVIPMAALLKSLSAVVLTAEGVRYAVHGRELGPTACESSWPQTNASAFVRLLDSTGELVGVARPGSAPNLLHPFVVLM